MKKLKVARANKIEEQLDRCLNLYQMAPRVGNAVYEGVIYVLKYMKSHKPEEIKRVLEVYTKSRKVGSDIAHMIYEGTMYILKEYAR